MPYSNRRPSAQRILSTPLKIKLARPEAEWKATLIKSYKVSGEVAEKMAFSFTQTTTCPLCGRMFDWTDHHGQTFTACDSIDHDHDTGKVRGRICQSCNTREGKWRCPVNGHIKSADEMTLQAINKDEDFLLIDWEGGWYKRCEEYRKNGQH